MEHFGDMFTGILGHGDFPCAWVIKPLACLLVYLLAGLALSFTILPKTGCVAALALANTNSVMSFTDTSLPSLSII